MQTSTTPIMTLAAQVAEAAAPHADRHDLEGSFVEEGISAARDLGYLAAPVPVELGGPGALTADIVKAQQVIARACGSTGLAAAMHLHVVLAAAWRWRRGDTAVEPLLRRVANDRIVVVSTGGNDWTRPTAIATPVEGGWTVSGRKTFASLSPAGDVTATFAAIGSPTPGAEVIGFGAALNAPGVSLDQTWDAAGMRGTGSHDLVFDNVFVAEKQVTARRKWGELDRPLLVASLHAWPVVYATYLGVAQALADAALTTGKATQESAAQIGLMEFHLRSGRWAIEGALADIGNDPEPSLENFVAVQLAKRTVTVACRQIATTAAELAGGRAYARRGPIDRMIRDLGAATYHPYPVETILIHAGQHRMESPLQPV
jgi:alkylation response protein AidB-like acyl-CoA dehydrogenase